MEAEPGIKERILSFFKGASEDYADVPKLSGAAKRYYRTYKKLFDEFSARNAENNAMEPFTNKNGSNVNKNSVSDNVRTINGNNMSVGDRQYAVEFNDKNEPFVVVEDDILSGVAEKEWINTVKRNLSSKYPNGIVLKNNTVVVNRQSRKEMTFSKYMSWLRANDPQAFSDKLRATNNSDEILNAASGWISEGLKHQRQDNIVDFARGNVLLRVGQNDYSASVIVGTQKNGTMLLYDIIDLKPTTITKKETFETIPVNPSQGVERKISNISDSSISQPEPKSNGFDKNSLENSSDKQFALPLDVDNFVANGEEFATPTLSTVGKERMTYKEKAFSKDWLFTKKTSAYIHAVDEMFGIQVYLEKVGGAKNAKASIQSVRSAPHQAQTMIGSVQYDIFKGTK